jgi:ribosome recycling factor
MLYNFTTFQNKIKETHDWLAREFATIRTGRATPALLDSVKVDAYGSMSPLNAVGSVSNEDPRTIRITPWDSSQIKAIEKAIVAANLGVSAIVDDKGVRVVFPELTGERREQLIKLGKQKLEDAKVAIRRERNEVHDDLQSKKKSGELGEDEMMRYKDQMEKFVSEANKKLDEAFDKKEKEIQN